METIEKEIFDLKNNLMKKNREKLLKDLGLSQDENFSNVLYIVDAYGQYFPPFKIISTINGAKLFGYKRKKNGENYIGSSEIYNKKFVVRFK